MDMLRILEEMRSGGYRLAHHGDEDDQVSWMFVHRNGHWVSGVGSTDAEALDMARSHARLGVEGKLVSPFRYPGAKSRQMEAICSLSDFSGLDEMRYVEPFAGGGSSLFYLIGEFGIPREVVMNDLDVSIASFWRCMEDERLKDGLIRKIENATPTLSERESQRRQMDSEDPVKSAFAGILINKTSFSGLMRKEAGPIGGKGQKSAYGVGCRYNAKTLVSRIEAIYQAIGGVVRGSSMDFADLIQQHDQKDVMIYCDPPYYHKGNKLYRKGMSDGDHVRLRDSLLALRNAFFVVSYDDCEEIRKLYEGFAVRSLEAFYSVSIEKSSRKSGNEIVISRS